MSRLYRIRVSETEERIIHVADGVQSRLQLLPVLSRQRMGELLGVELVEKGFEVTDDTARREDGEIAIEVDLASGDVLVRIQGERHVEVNVEHTLNSGRPLPVVRQEQARAELRDQAAMQADRIAEQRHAEITTVLERSLRSLRAELDDAVNKATAEALKEKAAQLGDVVETVEDATGSLTIRVKL